MVKLFDKPSQAAAQSLATHDARGLQRDLAAEPNPSLSTPALPSPERVLSYTYAHQTCE